MYLWATTLSLEFHMALFFSLRYILITFFFKNKELLSIVLKKSSLNRQQGGEDT